MRIFFTLFFLFSSLCTWAQTDSSALRAAPAPTVEELSAEIAELKAKGSTWDRILHRLPKMTAFIQTGYEWSETGSNFFLKRAIITLSGDIAPKFTYRFQVEFAGPPKLLDVFLRYSPYNQLNLQLGEFKVPFTIENTDYGPLQIELIENALPLVRLMGINEVCGLASTGRDVGAMLFGGFGRRDGYSILNYDLAVFNGEGLTLRDKNSSKDVVGRLTLRPVRGLALSGSYYWGEYGADYQRRIRYTGGVSYDRGAGVLRGEWIGGLTGDMRSSGWYATGGWRITPKLMSVVRCESFTQDESQGDTRQNNYTAGLWWLPWKYLRCQLNYTYEDYASVAVAHRNVVAVMFTGVF